jgi:hypothetical protein
LLQPCGETLLRGRRFLVAAHVLLPAGDAVHWAEEVCSGERSICRFFHSEGAARVGKMSYILSTMSGWGCRYQLDEKCRRLRKECKPGMPGCVLYGKVLFISDVPSAPVKKPPLPKAHKRTKRRSAKSRSAK